MNREQLLELGRRARLTPAELEAQAPEVFAVVAERAAAEVRDRLATGLAGVPPELTERIRTLPVEVHAGTDIRSSLLSRLLEESQDGVRTAVRGLLEGQTDPLAENPLRADLPLDEQPLLQPELASARILVLAEKAGIAAEVADRVLATPGSAGGLTDDILHPLVEAGTVPEADARALGLTSSLSSLLGQDALVSAVGGFESPRLRGGRITTLSDLVQLRSEDWDALVRRPEVAVPEGRTAEEYAGELRERVARLFPTDALLARMLPADPAEIREVLSEEEGRHVESLASRFPGLGIAEIAADQQLSMDERVKRVTGRIGDIARLAELNPDRELLALDLSSDSDDVRQLQFEGIYEGAREPVLRTLRAYQRTMALTGDVADTETLVRAGYTSALAVTEDDVDTLAARTGLAADRAAKYYAEASSVATMVLGTAGSVLDIATGDFDLISAVANLTPSTKDYVRRLDGYATLFGNQAYCTCEHCASVLSPAAYFVDLMRFVEDNVTSKVFTGAFANSVLRLQARRPDLWTTPLTCAATTTLVPTLDLIDEVLENYLAIDRGFAGDLNDRAAVQKVVYRDLLSGSEESPRLPFVLPLMRLRSYLGHLDRRLDSVARLVGAPEQTVAAALFGLSQREYDLVTSPDADVGFLQTVFDMPLASGGLATPLQAFDVQQLVRGAGASREQLGDLLASRFVAASGATVSVKSEKTDASSVQNDVERVHGLTPPALDRVHRMSRLWRASEWTVRELDLVLTVTAASTLTSVDVQAAARLATLQRRLGLSVEEAGALWAGVPRHPVDHRPALFDRLFNPQPFVASDGRYPKDAVRFTHQALRTAGPGTADATQHRLQGALGLSDEHLLQLIRNLATPLGADLSAATDEDRGFALTETNLGLLYRHARLAQLLRLPVPELFGRIRCIPGLPGYVRDAADVIALLDFAEWLKTSGYDIYDLAILRRESPADPSRQIDPTAVVQALMAEVAAEDLLRFADTVFAFLPGITEADSRRLVAANAARIVGAGAGRYRLADNFNASVALAVPAGLVLDEPAARALLGRYSPAQVLPARLAGPLGVSADVVSALIDVLGVSLVGGDVSAALHGNKPPAVLQTLVRDLAPLAVLLRGLDAFAIRFVSASRGLFDLADPRALTLDSARHVGRYAGFVRRAAEASPTLAPEKLQALLTAHTAANGFAGANQDDLSRLLGLEPGVLATVLPAVTLPAAALPALERLVEAADLTRHLGISGQALRGMGSTDYDSLTAAADALLGALRARYPEKEWPERIDPLEDVVRSRRRDALCEQLLRSSFPQFTSRADLYQHFLLDVEMEGEARTSRVVAAISSVQLYVSRILMNLEQDRRDPSDPAHVEVPPTRIDPDEWSWRRNYRLWEANRKVFLWPENYLEPELRDDKTPLFEELESTLLQQPITEQHVLDAFSTYLAGFEQLASMQIAGSYLERDPVASTDVLHLFGVTSSDPPVYHYRTGTNVLAGAEQPGRATVWSPWKRLDIQISARKVSPFVYEGRLHVFWVGYATKPKSSVAGGTSTFTGYTHTMDARFSTLRLDGTWSAPQKLSMPAIVGQSPGAILDQLDSHGRPMYDQLTHPEPKEGYTLSGVRWERLYPITNALGSPALSFGFDFYPISDLFTRSASWGHWGNLAKESRLYHVGYAPRTLRYWPYKWTDYAFATKYLDRQRTSANYPPSEPAFDWIDPLLAPDHLMHLPPKAQLSVVNGALDHLLIEVGPDILLLQGLNTAGSPFLLRRIGTTLGSTLGRILYTSGVKGLLDLNTQKSLKEAALPVTKVQVPSRVVPDRIDFAGPYGAYFREIFFHVPALLANALNGRQEFAAAQQWWSHIFDPTASEHIPPEADAADQAARRRDRNWRYLEFRGLTVPKMREILTDPATLQAYRDDPFNPHAIARLRISAYQKSVVMKYVDNLLDWGDRLFATFTAESVNEATLAYATAAAILGNRPPQLGSCGEAVVSPRNYEKIRPLLGKHSDFLIELETWHLGKVIKAKEAASGSKATFRYAASPTVLEQAVEKAAVARRPVPLTAVAKASADSSTLGNYTGWSKAKAVSWIGKDNGVGVVLNEGGPNSQISKIPKFAVALIRQISPVFGVPRNENLLRYWDRVEDRLYKIRNSRDITGTSRRLALFAAEIDPAMVVRARAAGLSFDEVLGATGGDLPPYRFATLIERAKAHTATVQSFGAALLGALEKRDVEELNRLRTTQQQNVLRLTTRLRRWDIEAAEDAVEGVARQTAAAEYRRDYFQGLVDGGLSDHESTQATYRHAASLLYGAAGTLDVLAGVLHLIPELGSPFALKYGGKQLGSSASSWSGVAKDAGTVAEAISASAGLEAGFERRREGWEHQVELARKELAVLEKQSEAAQIRKSIAERSLELHERSIDQLDELAEFSAGKFSNLGLYTWLSATLQRTYREAYNSAFAMARLAEQAYRFERGEEDASFLRPAYWDSERAGLLAGEQLLVDLQSMERRHLETNYRGFEIDQAFSLTQVDPTALVDLRETGECTFALSELFYNLFYPGHYKRRVKSVRLTIPAVTGPYTNVSATLTLLGSTLRVRPQTGAGAVVDVPVRRSTSIATSTAQQDAGVFELSFRDERYMPFEGAGAVSSWRLTLPKSFRPFDYRTITDVVLHVTYTAEGDEVFRQAVESNNAAAEGSIRNYLSTSPLTRVFSLRQDFSAVFQRLLHEPANTSIRFAVGAEQLPLFLQGMPVKNGTVKVALVPRPGQDLTGARLRLGGVELTGFTPDATLGNLPSVSADAGLAPAFLGEHTLTVLNPGKLAPDKPLPGDASAIDADKLRDVLLVVEYAPA